jgi:putative ABC transport system substrate-binding protein
MRRREFISLLGSAATAWPLGVNAQQPAAMPVIGFLRSTSLAPFPHLVTAFRQGLKELGFIEGQNVAVELRSDESPDRLHALVNELVRRPVDLIVGNAVAAIAAKAATTTIPIVFASGADPVKDGLVANLNRPGGNVTGVHFFAAVLGAKRLELLRLVAPKAATIGVLALRNTANTELERSEVLAAAQAVGQQLILGDVTSSRDIETAFATFAQRRAGALLVGGGAFINSHRERIAALAARHRLPAISAWREAVVAGGLMSYGTSQSDAYRLAGTYAARILKGEKPGDLPVIQGAKFELVVNLKTAKALGLEIPDRVLALADEVIE